MSTGFKISPSNRAAVKALVDDTAHTAFNDPVEALTADLGGYWQGDTGYFDCGCCGEGHPVRQGSKHSATLKRKPSGGMLFRCYRGGCSFQDFLSFLEGLGYTASQTTIAPMTKAERIAMDVRAAEARAESQAKCEAIWNEGRRILVGDHVWTYLINRGISETAILKAIQAGDLRAHNNLPWGFCDELGKHLRFPAMLARITRPDGQMSLHRTYQDGAGGKAPVTPARKGFGPQDGGTVTLRDDPDGHIGVVEGIETGLALMSGLAPDCNSVFAALSAPNLKTLHLPVPASDTREIVIYADGDQAGRDAASKAVAHLARVRPQNPTKIITAKDETDFNDLLISKLRARGAIQ